MSPSRPLSLSLYQVILGNTALSTKKKKKITFWKEIMFMIRLPRKCQKQCAWMFTCFCPLMLFATSHAWAWNTKLTCWPMFLFASSFLTTTKEMSINSYNSCKKMISKLSVAPRFWVFDTGTSGEERQWEILDSCACREMRFCSFSPYNCFSCKRH